MYGEGISALLLILEKYIGLFGEKCNNLHQFGNYRIVQTSVQICSNSGIWYVTHLHPQYGQCKAISKTQYLDDSRSFSMFLIDSRRRPCTTSQAAEEKKNLCNGNSSDDFQQFWWTSEIPWYVRLIWPILLQICKQCGGAHWMISLLWNSRSFRQFYILSY